MIALRTGSLSPMTLGVYNEAIKDHAGFPSLLHRCFAKEGTPYQVYVLLTDVTAESRRGDYQLLFREMMDSLRCTRSSAAGAAARSTTVS